MMLTRIGHGNLVAIARSDVFIVLRPLPGKPEIDKELGVHIWHALSSERGIQKAVSILAQSGFEDMPEFALVHPDNNNLHIIVRGNFNVLLLNHDGLYDSVDAQGVATWRELKDVPASEWCIRGIPGLTLDRIENFYLSSGVSSVSVMASLGWDDPDTPMNHVEAVETGGIEEVELKQDSIVESVPSHAVVPPALPTITPLPAHSHALVDPEPVAHNLVSAIDSAQQRVIDSAPVNITSLETQAFPILPDYLEELESGDASEPAYVPEPLPASEPAYVPEPVQSPELTQVMEPIDFLELAVPEPPVDDAVAFDVPEAAGLPVIPPPPAANAAALRQNPLVEQMSFAELAAAAVQPRARILEPLDGPSYGAGAPVNEYGHAAPETDEENTMLTNNIVEIRQSMEGNVEPQLSQDQITAVFNVRTPMIKLSNGVRIALDRTVLIGRAPEASRVPLREMPRLVNVVSPNNDISRTHAQIRVEGEFVLVTDLNSTNGVFLIEPGQAPRRLHPDEPVHIELGVVVDLGDGVTFELEEPL